MKIRSYKLPFLSVLTLVIGAIKPNFYGEVLLLHGLYTGSVSNKKTGAKLVCMSFAPARWLCRVGHLFLNDPTRAHCSDLVVCVTMEVDDRSTGSAASGLAVALDVRLAVARSLAVEGLGFQHGG